ncbi:di-/tricarboxylate transporter [Halobacteroides halobius DSM 5150]|uniref:Di-/tricarboxylate transporter n=2 Tax=Halobacteroides TaxID=42417 RepID=L0KAG7_HALHC|nr:SLC13 family permease [Halobacteroides halobius]AGB41349.1 di-/tricarboxylate transporter [Halobacteroides halobius DSM 5150]
MRNFSFSFISLVIISLFFLTLFQPVAVNAAELDINSTQLSPEINLGMVIVTIIVIIAVILFLWEPVRPDIVALGVPVVLVSLNRWTKVSVAEALSGFSNEATIAVLAMFILSEGIRRSGLMQIIGDKIMQLTAGKEKRQLGVITGLSGLTSGMINNTPVVAAFIPMVTELAEKTKTSPSKLLIPLSYASMMGGTMTLLGTSTNLLASGFSARLLDHPFSMFEFTKLGAIIFVIGIIYLLTAGRYLTPERIEPNEDLVEEYEVGDFLTEVIIEIGSPLIGHSVGRSLDEINLDMDLVKIIRNGKEFIKPLDSKSFQAGDHLIVRTDRRTLMELIETEGLKHLSETKVTERELEEPKRGQKLIEVIISYGSYLEGQTLNEVNFIERYNTSILAVRRGRELTHQQMNNIALKPGDVLLLLTNETTLDRLRNNPNFIITREIEKSVYRRSKIPIALASIIGVVALGGLNILPTAISALGGVLAMILTGCIEPKEIYDAVNWEVIFLLAGLIPLGIAIEQTGTANYIANQLLAVAGFLPAIVMLGLFYLLTSLLTNIISNNASVVLMIPVAIETAQILNANPFSFVIAVTFAASAAFMTPIGYQTNLMVYGPGGYKFRDFIKVGAPLQLLLTIITPLCIALLWGL